MAYLKKAEEEKIYEVVRGNLPRSLDYSKWDENKFLALYSFFMLFIVEGQDEEGRVKMKWQLNQKMWDEAVEKYWDGNENIYYKEFFYRINKRKANEARLKVFKFASLAGTYLKNNPAKVTTLIYDKLYPYEMFRWLLSVYDTAMTKIGAEEVITNNLDRTQPNLPQRIRVAPMEAHYSDALTKGVDVLQKLLGSVTDKDIRQLKGLAKFTAISKMMPILNYAKNNPKPNRVFKQLNIYAANREQLEDAFLKYNELNEFSEEEASG